MAKKTNINFRWIAKVLILFALLFYVVWQFSLHASPENKGVASTTKCGFGTVIKTQDYGPWLPAMSFNCKAWLSPLFESLGL